MVYGRSGRFCLIAWSWALHNGNPALRLLKAFIVLHPTASSLNTVRDVEDPRTAIICNGAIIASLIMLIGVLNIERLMTRID